MRKVILWGTGSFAKRVYELIDKNKCHIQAFADNDEKKIGCKFYDKDIISPSSIFNYEFDYIIIASMYFKQIEDQIIEMKIASNKCISFLKYYYYKDEYKEKINKFCELQYNPEVLITGLSYADCGIHMDSMKLKNFNFSLGSQDLYYGFKTIKYISEKYKDKFKDVKYLIIGITYYSFQYDLSLSKATQKIVAYGYYDILKDLHNCTKDVIEEVFEFNCIMNTILKPNHLEIYLNQELKKYKDAKKDLEGYAKSIAELDSNKNYPNTVSENKKILKEYLNFLRSLNINPIIVVFPVTKYYSKYFSNRIKEEYMEIMNEIKGDFQYLDYFDSKLFDLDDFLDASHLNTEGAKKFTKIINDYLI